MGNISSIEMRNLIFEALSIENAEDTPHGNTFHESDGGRFSVRN